MRINIKILLLKTPITEKLNLYIKAIFNNYLNNIKKFDNFNLNEKNIIINFLTNKSMDLYNPFFDNNYILILNKTHWNRSGFDIDILKNNYNINDVENKINIDFHFCNICQKYQIIYKEKLNINEKKNINISNENINESFKKKFENFKINNYLFNIDYDNIERMQINFKKEQYDIINEKFNVEIKNIIKDIKNNEMFFSYFLNFNSLIN